MYSTQLQNTDLLPQTTTFITLRTNQIPMTDEEYQELFEEFLRDFIERNGDLLDQIAERF